MYAYSRAPSFSLCIVQQDKSHTCPLGDMAARLILIATAVGAYDEDSLYRAEYNLSLGPTGMLIVMLGSWPTSFKIGPDSIIARVQSDTGTRVYPQPCDKFLAQS